MELPREIWKEISMTDSLTYLKMVQCCKAFKLDDNFIKDHFTKCYIDSRSSVIIYKLPNGDIHGCGDQPAIICPNGLREWRKNNLLHRDNDMPAVIDNNGMEWWTRGVPHRIGGPAVINTNNSKFWIQNGKFHRDDDLPAICSKDEQVWYQHGKKHRDGDKPARIWGNIQEWYHYDVLYKTVTTD
jgi:hypothetical protein